MNTPKFKLLSGREIPLIGLGTYTITEKKNVEHVLDLAFAAGYRLIDTAVMYNNERDIGEALKSLLPKHNLKREDVFITSKLYPSDHGKRAKNAVVNSLANLQSGYIDLYLIHWPGVFNASRSTNEAKLRAESWKALVEAQQEGIVKDIGVSNYTVTHLTELLSNCYGSKPTVNQIEWHPYCHDEKIKEFCDKEGILVQGYMPLGGSGNTTLLNDQHVVNISKKLKKSCAQILLKWSLQRNICVIPKSKSKQHLADNINLDFDISSEDMDVLNNSKIFRRFDWDPNGVV